MRTRPQEPKLMLFTCWWTKWYEQSKQNINLRIYFRACLMYTFLYFPLVPLAHAHLSFWRGQGARLCGPDAFTPGHGFKISDNTPPPPYPESITPNSKGEKWESALTSALAAHIIARITLLWHCLRAWMWWCWCGWDTDTLLAFTTETEIKYKTN